MLMFLLFLLVAAASAQKEISCSDLADIIAQNNNEVQMKLKRIENCQNFQQWNDIQRSNFVNVSRIDMAFYIGTEKMHWENAKAWCTLRGMTLATMKTDEKIWSFVNSVIKDIGYLDDVFWVSASDNGRVCGDFKWEDQTPVDKDLWDREYPKAFKEDELSDTGVLLSTFLFGSLRDQKWYNKNMYLCQVPPELIACL